MTPSPFRSSGEHPQILVATDGDAASWATLDAAAALAVATGASVHVLRVLAALMYATPEMTAIARRDRNTHPEASRHMEAALQRLRDRGVQTVESSIEFGIAVDVIVAFANDGRFSRLVVGGADHEWLATQVGARSKIPITVVPPGA